MSSRAARPVQGSIGYTGRPHGSLPYQRPSLVGGERCADGLRDRSGRRRGHRAGVGGAGRPACARMDAEGRAVAGGHLRVRRGRVSKLVGVDVGGTFTDLVLVDETTGAVRVAKVPTTVSNQADGVQAALAA